MYLAMSMLLRTSPPYSIKRLHRALTAIFSEAKWTFFAMVNAEELGITSQNIDAAILKGHFSLQIAGTNDNDLGADTGTRIEMFDVLVHHANAA